MPKVSVIIPVYNAKDYLARCLDSVCNQTLKDIEIICVNDASTDNSIDILNQYAKRYLNLKVIDCLKNGGESVARNIGLDSATGEYIGFVDNDDKIDLDFYEKLYKVAITKKLDIAKAECYEVTIDDKKIVQDDNVNIVNNDKFAFVTHWWTAIYNREIIIRNNIRFKEYVILGGDIIFLNEVLIGSEAFDVINGTYYYHYHRKNNMDNVDFLSIRKIKSAVQSYYDIVKNLTKNYPVRVSKMGYNYAVAYYMQAIYTKTTKNKSKEASKICIDAMFELLDIVKNSYTIKNRLCSVCPWVVYFYIKNDKKNLVSLMLENSNITQVQFVVYQHKIRLLKGF